MAKPRSRLLDYGVYLVVRLGVCLIQACPFETAHRCADGLAWLVCKLNRRHNQVARDNLRHAFPQLSEAQRERLVYEVYRHFCRLVVEVVYLPRIFHVGNWRRYTEFSDPIHAQRYMDCLLSGRSIMIVTGHFGNWELAGYIVPLLGFKIHAIARPIDNPYLDRYIRRFREATGQKILAKKGDFDTIEAVLASGGVLATLADQDAGQRGLYVEFFGRPASTHKAIALLALEHRVPLVVGGSARVAEPMHYRAYIEDVILPEEYEGRPDAARAITQRYTAALERLIRRHPEQYLWLHRRWKHQPKAKQKAA
ncbi:MAG: lysophospholipid acyltransferase family protein [Gemmataceae bacterium]